MVHLSVAATVSAAALAGPAAEPDALPGAAPPPFDPDAGPPLTELGVPLPLPDPLLVPLDADAPPPSAVCCSAGLVLDGALMSAPCRPLLTPVPPPPPPPLPDDRRLADTEPDELGECCEPLDGVRANCDGQPGGPAALPGGLPP